MSKSVTQRLLKLAYRMPLRVFLRGLVFPKTCEPDIAPVFHQLQKGLTLGLNIFGGVILSRCAWVAHEVKHVCLRGPEGCELTNSREKK